MRGPGFEDGARTGVTIRKQLLYCFETCTRTRPEAEQGCTPASNRRRLCFAQAAPPEHIASRGPVSIVARLIRPCMDLALRLRQPRLAF